MFDLSTKVKILASSYHKKTGPRKNSIGYITAFPSSTMVMYDLNVVIIHAVVRFLHYGNEEKNRAETKSVLLMFPIFQGKGKSSPLQRDIKSKLNEFIHSVNYGQWDSGLTKIYDRVSMPSNMPIILAAPFYTPETNLQSCSKSELCCWLESCLLSGQINTFVNSTLSSNHFVKDAKQGVTVSDLMDLQQIMVDKEARKLVLESLCVNSIKRARWISMLRMIIITAGQVMQQDSTKRLIDKMTDNVYTNNADRFGIKTAYLILAPYIFCQQFPRHKNTCIKMGKFTKYIKTMEDTKEAIINLTRC